MNSSSDEFKRRAEKYSTTVMTNARFGGHFYYLRKFHQFGTLSAKAISISGCMNYLCALPITFMEDV
jgi:hypothetical protein